LKRRAAILIIEDEAKVARALQEGLAAEHRQVIVAKTGEMKEDEK
jgi:DNA-binding response OmpR family regulator